MTAALAICQLLALFAVWFRSRRLRELDLPCFAAYLLFQFYSGLVTNPNNRMLWNVLAVGGSSFLTAAVVECIVKIGRKLGRLHRWMLFVWCVGAPSIVLSAAWGLNAQFGDGILLQAYWATALGSLCVGAVLILWKEGDLPAGWLMWHLAILAVYTGGCAGRRIAYWFVTSDAWDVLYKLDGANRAVCCLAWTALLILKLGEVDDHGTG